jgi:hypothetical protein
VGMFDMILHVQVACPAGHTFEVWDVQYKPEKVIKSHRSDGRGTRIGEIVEDMPPGEWEFDGFAFCEEHNKPIELLIRVKDGRVLSVEPHPNPTWPWP